MLALLLVFLAALLGVLVVGIVWLGHHYFDGNFEQIAPGLWKTISQLGKPFAGVLVLGLAIPTIAFAFVGRRLRGRWVPWLILSVLLFFSLSASGLNVIISYVGRFFQSALAEKDAPTFWRYLWIYASVFILATPLTAYYGYIQDKLGLHWRRWLTQNFLDRYFNNRAYYALDSNPDIDNPDQRITEDVRSFTSTSLSFLLIILDSLIALIAFTGVLWSISHVLVGVLLVYATFGTFVTVVLGRRLIRLNFNQLRQEANLRYGLVHVRDNAESIAFYQGEGETSVGIRQRLSNALSNFNVLIGWQRNLSFFTTGYGYFVIIVPTLVVAPRYFAGELDFGAIAQAGFAFSQVLGALSIVIDRFESLSAFAAGIDRLYSFKYAMVNPGVLPQLSNSPTSDLASDLAMDQQISRPVRQPVDRPVSQPLSPQADRPLRQQISRQVGSGISLDQLTLFLPTNERKLIEELSFELPVGQGLLVMGPSGCGKSSLLRAIATLWSNGTGTITAPDIQEMMFLPQKPYMPLGNLRYQLLYPNRYQAIGDEALQAVLSQVNLANLPERVGGFEVNLDWPDVLSLGEQQRLAFARLLLAQPRYAILDEATSALDLDNERMIYQRLISEGVTLLSVGHRDSLRDYHDWLLRLSEGGDWQLTKIEKPALVS